MPRIYIFNPENDLALANGGRNYFAPKNVIRLKDLGSFLPFWIADDGDYIACRCHDTSWMEQIRKDFKLHGETFDSIQSDQHIIPSPWGWSISAVENFIKLGISPETLPSEEYIDNIRRISHRRTSIEINRRLKSCGIDIPDLPFEISRETDIDTARQKTGRFIIKAPWSSSGRGIIDSTSLSDKELKRQIMGIIKHQGSAIVEKYLDKIHDFAMLFKSENGLITYEGISLFFNHRGSSYAGNILGSQDFLLSSLTRYVNREHLYRISNRLEEILRDVIGTQYNGFLGVDMMVYRSDDGNTRIAPCIELNLRMTMGAVALSLSSRYLDESSTGVLNIRYGRRMPRSEPVIRNGRLYSGTVDLVPPNDYFQFLFEAAPVSEMNPHRFL